MATYIAPLMTVQPVDYVCNAVGPIQMETTPIWFEGQQRDLPETSTSSPFHVLLYDEKKELVIYTDASTSGIGAVMMQEGTPIAYASRALSETAEGTTKDL